jgi:hypothetical protein
MGVFKPVTVEQRVELLKLEYEACAIAKISSISFEAARVLRQCYVGTAE